MVVVFGFGGLVVVVLSTIVAFSVISMVADPPVSFALFAAMVSAASMV